MKVKGLVKAVSLKDKGGYGIMIGDKWYNAKKGNPPFKGEEVELDFMEDGIWNTILDSTKAFSDTHPNVSKEMRDAKDMGEVYEGCFDFIAELIKRKEFNCSSQDQVAMTATLFIQKSKR